MATQSKKGLVSFLQEYSIPLIVGVVLAVVWANIPGISHYYHVLVEWQPFGHHATIFGHHITVHFIINDVFMPCFFGIAAKEIVESFLPGGDLNPIRKAINPLLATIGGVFGPILVYRLFVGHFYGDDPDTFAMIWNGWGIPTATDIALAWLLARVVFGKTHPAVNYLLLLAIADDAIGLGIIAIKYPDLAHPVHLEQLWLVGLGMAFAYVLRRFKVKHWGWYIFGGGILSWFGLLTASLHPALALVPIVPFMPGPSRDTGLFQRDDEVDETHGTHGGHGSSHSTLHNYEHDTKLFVDLGLFFFGLANAGVAFGAISNVTWSVLGALVFGKTIGITVCAAVGVLVGAKLPQGMSLRHIVVAGLVASLGLTVALFVAGEAFPAGSPHQDPAKMGALLTLFVPLLAIPAGRLLRVKQLDG